MTNNQAGNNLPHQSIIDSSDSVFDAMRFKFNTFYFSSDNVSAIKDGALASETNPEDRAKFLEIDPDRLASDPFDPDVEWYTYGAPGSAALPIPGTDYDTYGKTGIGTGGTYRRVYGHPRFPDADPISIYPEDPRSSILEMLPKRVNYARNPAFKYPLKGESPTDDKVGMWSSIGNVSRVDNVLRPVAWEYPKAIQENLRRDENGVVAVSPPPFSDSALKMDAGSEIVFGTLDYRSSIIWLQHRSVSGESGSNHPVAHNWWKFACITDSRSSVKMGMWVYSGSFAKRVFASFYSEPLPWDKDSTKQDKPLWDTDPSDREYSKSGWYVMYAVVDLGPDAKWGVPFVRIDPWAPYPAQVTDLCIENWDMVSTIQGPAKMLYDRFDSLGPGHQYRTAEDEDPNTYDNLAIDPLITFNGGDDMATRNHTDTVYMGYDPSNSISGYYPQRVIRHQSADVLIRHWLPVGRTSGFRYVTETG